MSHERQWGEASHLLTPFNPLLTLGPYVSTFADGKQYYQFAVAIGLC